MSAGAIPVFVGRDLVRPFDEEFDWDKFSFVFTPDEVGPGLIETLRAVPPEQLKEMQVRARGMKKKYFLVYFAVFCQMAIVVTNVEG